MSITRLTGHPRTFAYPLRDARSVSSTAIARGCLASRCHSRLVGPLCKHEAAQARAISSRATIGHSGTPSQDRELDMTLDESFAWTHSQLSKC
jgi:hypothetical protein